MNVPIFATIVDTPSITSITIGGGGELEIAVARGGSSPDFVHYHLYYSSSPGIDITDSGTYDGFLQFATDNTNDLGPWTAPQYFQLVEVAYDGTESSPTAEYSVTDAAGSDDVPSARAVRTLRAVRTARA